MRKGFDGLAALVQQHLPADPFSGRFFVFCGRRGDLVKLDASKNPEFCAV
jgi:transposase